MADKNLMVVLSADTSGFTKAMGEVKNTTQSATDNVKKGFSGVTNTIGNVAKSVGKIAVASGVFKAVDAGINMITSSFDTAITRVDTLNRFPQVLQRMGYGADEANKATTRLAEGIQGLPTTLQDVTGTTQRLVSVFGDVDMATESTLALNNAFLASGASQADASRGLEQYVQMLSSGKVDMQSWRTLQETMPFALQKTAEAFGFTGKTAQRDFYSALQDGDITMEQFNEKLIELSTAQGGFAEIALEASKGISTSWQNIQTAIATGVANVIGAFDEWLNSNGFGGISGVLDNIKVAVQNTFGSIVDYIPQVLDVFGSLYNKIADSTAWNSLKEMIDIANQSIQALWDKLKETGAIDGAISLLKQVGEAVLNIDFVKVTEDIASFLDKWSPLILGIGGAVGTFKLITGAITTWNTIVGIATTLVTVFSTAFASAMAFILSPIGAVVLAVGALIAVGVLLYKNWDSVKEYLSNVWDAIKEKANEVFEPLAEFFTDVWERIKEIFSTTVEFISNVIEVGFMLIQSIIEGVFLFIQSIIQAGVNIWQSIIQFGMDLIKEIIELVWNAIGEYIMAILETIRGIIETVWNAISSIISTTVEAIQNVVTTVWGAISDVTSSVFNSIKGFLETIWNGISSFISNMVQTIQNAISNAWNAVSNVTSSIFNAVMNTTSSIWNSIQSTISSIVNGVLSVVSNIWNSISNVTSSVFNSIQSTASSVWNGIKNAMTEPIESAKNIISGIIDSIKGFFSNIRLRLPEIEMPSLPHFSLSGSFSLNPPSVPHLSVDWYETGGIATSASVVGIGENGSEAILPLSNKKRMKPFAQAVASMMGDESKTNSGVAEKTQTIIQGNNFIIREEADIQKVAKQLFELEKKEARAKGKGRY